MRLVLLLLLALAACGSTEDRRLRGAADTLLRADPAALTAQERAEAAWLAALADPEQVQAAVAAAPVTEGTIGELWRAGRARAALGAQRAQESVAAGWSWDWRSYFSGVGRSRPFWPTEGAVYRATLTNLGRADMEARLRASEAALQAGERWRGMAGAIAARGGAERQALIGAMAAAAEADSRAIRQGLASGSAYAAAQIRRMNAIADQLGAIGAALWRERAATGLAVGADAPGPVRASG